MIETADFGDTVRVMLIKSEESDGMVDLIRGSSQPAQILDKGTYWMIEGKGEIALDAEDLGDRLGRDVTVEDILVNFATYAGRVEVGDSVVRVTAEFLQIGPQDSQLR